MSRSLLDTNIISNVTKPVPSDGLVAWMAEQADEDPFISSLTVDEILRGILELAWRTRTSVFFFWPLGMLPTPTVA